MQICHMRRGQLLRRPSGAERCECSPPQAPWLQASTCRPLESSSSAYHTPAAQMTLNIYLTCPYATAQKDTGSCCILCTRKMLICQTSKWMHLRGTIE